MKNHYIIPSIIIASAILAGFWILKGANEPQKVVFVRPPSISIHKAAEKGDIKAVKQHLNAGTDVNAKADFGYRPLFFAVEGGHKEIAKLLISNGAGVNAKEKGARSPLMMAAYYGHKEIVELLIANGANVNSKRRGYATPLDATNESKNPEGLKKSIEDLLRKHGGKTGEELKAEGK
jgi:ankyrin repeat protein